MPGPGAGKYISPRQPVTPGRDPNLALEAMSEAADRDVQRQQITAQLQQEAMRMSMEGAQLKVAAAQDMSRGIMEANEGVATRKENERQRQFAEAESARERAFREKSAKKAQEAALARQTQAEDATRVNLETERTSKATAEKAKVEQRTKETKLQQLNVELKTLLSYRASGLGVSSDPAKAAAQADQTDAQIRRIHDGLQKLGAGVSRDILEQGFEIQMNASLNTRQNAKAQLETQKQLTVSAGNRERAIKIRDQQLTVQTLRFGAVHGESIIDAGLAEGLPAAEMANRVRMLYSQADMSNPKQKGFGLLRAMSMNEGRDAKLLNRVQSKLGPFGMSTLDAFSLSVSEFNTALGDPASPEIGAYRAEVIGNLDMDNASARQNPSYSAIQHGFAADEGRKFIDQYRQEHGAPPSKQVFDNFKRQIRLDHIPGNMRMKEIYPDPFPTELPSYQERLQESSGPITVDAATTGQALATPEASGRGSETFGAELGQGFRTGAVDAFMSFGKGVEATGKAVEQVGKGVYGFGEGVTRPSQRRRPTPQR